MKVDLFSEKRRGQTANVEDLKVKADKSSPKGGKKFGSRQRSVNVKKIKGKGREV